MSCQNGVAEDGILKIKNFLHTDTVLTDYQITLDAMKVFTHQRLATTPDQLWIMEHPPVYTLGQAANPAHVLNAGDIPVVKVDRGGQVTYHGPGQLMFYLLADLSVRGIGVRELVEAVELAVINTLLHYGIEATGDRKAPGVYVDNKKIAALGFRISRKRCYHGLCFNYNFDAEPFKGINPCGYEGMQITQLASLVTPLPSKQDVSQLLIDNLVKILGYTNTKYLSAQL